MSVKDGLLALLNGTAKHGYQLKVDFERSTGGAWTLNVGQVYTSLQRLERDGLVELETDDGERKTYRLTAAGRTHLGAWLLDPVDRTPENRDEVVMKILLAVNEGAGDPFAVIAAQRTSTMRALQDYTREKAGGDGDLSWLVHLDRLILRCRAELDWLDLVEERIHRADDRPLNRPESTT